MEKARSAPAWFGVGLLFLALAYADVALAPPFGLLFNTIFAGGACVVAAKGFRSAGQTMQAAFAAEFLFAAITLILLFRALSL